MKTISNSDLISVLVDDGNSDLISVLVDDGVPKVELVKYENCSTVNLRDLRQTWG